MRGSYRPPRETTLFDKRDQDGPRRRDASVVYFIQADQGGLVKVGRTSNMVERLGTMAQCCPIRLRVLGVIRGYIYTETDIHRRFRHLRVRQEWHRPGDDLLAFIAENAEPYELPLDPWAEPVARPQAAGAGSEPLETSGAAVDSDGVSAEPAASPARKGAPAAGAGPEGPAPNCDCECHRGGDGRYCPCPDLDVGLPPLLAACRAAMASLYGGKTPEEL